MTGGGGQVSIRRVLGGRQVNSQLLAHQWYPFS